MSEKNSLNYRLKAVLKDDKEYLLSDYTHVTITDIASGSARITCENTFKQNDVISIKLNDEVVFTGFVDVTETFNAKSTATLREGTKEFHTKELDLSYRKEKAKNILEEVLSEANITEYTIDFTDEEIERFHIKKDCPHYIIKLLADTASLYTGEKILVFFDEKGKFFFVSEAKYKQENIKEFVEGENIISLSPGFLESFPSNVRANNKIKINDIENKITMSSFTFNNGKGRSKLYYECC